MGNKVTKSNENEVRDFMEEYEQVQIVRTEMARDLEMEIVKFNNGNFIVGHYPNYSVACVTNDGKLFAQFTPIVAKKGETYSKYYEVTTPYKTKFELDTCELCGSYIVEIFNEHFEPKIISNFEKAKAKHEELMNERKEESNNVNHPQHYNRDGAMECIDEMILLFSVEETMSFCKLNAWKYRSRANDKGGLEDLQKSDWYIAKFKELKELSK